MIAGTSTKKTRVFYNRTLNRLIVPVANGLKAVLVEKIIYLEANNSYCRMFVEGEQHFSVFANLNTVEKELKDFNFTRSHKSFLINLNHLSEYCKLDGGYITLKKEHKVPVSRGKKSDLINFLYE